MVSRAAVAPLISGISGRVHTNLVFIRRLRLRSLEIVERLGKVSPAHAWVQWVDVFLNKLFPLIFRQILQDVVVDVFTGNFLAFFEVIDLLEHLIHSELFFCHIRGINFHLIGQIQLAAQLLFKQICTQEFVIESQDTSFFEVSACAAHFFGVEVIVVITTAVHRIIVVPVAVSFVLVDNSVIGVLTVFVESCDCGFITHASPAADAAHSDGEEGFCVVVTALIRILLVPSARITSAVLSSVSRIETTVVPFSRQDIFDSLFNFKPLDNIRSELIPVPFS